MALDLNRKLSFSGSGKRGGKAATAFPEKTYINLMPRSDAASNPVRNAIVIVVAVVLVALFAKFGVYDFYAQVGAKQSQLATQQAALSTLESQLADYEEVAAEYEGYEIASLATSDLPVDAMSVLSLVDRCVTPNANVVSLSLEGDTLLLNLSGTSLDSLGRLTSELEQQSEVKSVSVSTASSKTDAKAGTSASVTVILQSPYEAEKGA